MAVNMFVYAKGLRRESSFCDFIIGANVYGVATYTWFESELKQFTLFSRYYLPMDFVIFGVLGADQFNFFHSILEGYKIVDITKSIPTYIDYINPKNHLHVYYQSRRIAMVKSVMYQLMETPKFPSTADWIICERDNEIVEIKNSYPPELIRNINIIVHAIGLKIRDDNLDFKLDSIILSFVGYEMTRTFKDTSEFQDFVKNLCNGEVLELGNADDIFGVMGNDQLEFFEYVIKPVGKVKFIDVSEYIPEDINLICQDMNHARYHAQRIQYFNSICLEMVPREDLFSGNSPPQTMEYKKPYISMKHKLEYVNDTTNEIEIIN